LFAWSVSDQAGADISNRYHTIYDSEQRQNWEPENITRVREHVDRTGDPNVMVEITAYPNTSPTPRQVEKAWNLYSKTYDNAVENDWFELQNGLESGYFNWEGDTFHYPHQNYTRQSGTLNPDKPEFLMYYRDPENRSNFILAGVMFQTSKVEKHGRQIGGPITRWHYHYFNPKICLAHWGAVSNVELIEENGEKCPENTLVSDKSYEMLHVWFVEHPKSQFSSDMVISEGVLKEGTKKLTKEKFISKHR